MNKDSRIVSDTELKELETYYYSRHARSREVDGAIGLSSWRWECPCGSRGRWQWQHPDCSFNLWLKHVAKNHNWDSVSLLAAQLYGGVEE